MSNQTKKGGLFRAASILLLINVIYNIVSLVLLLPIIAIFIMLLSIAMSQVSPEEQVMLGVLIAVYSVLFVIAVIASIVYIILYSIARKKLLKANAKKDYKGWMIACIVISALFSSGSILGLTFNLVGPILALCVPNSDFEAPEEAGYTDNSFAADNTTADF